MQLLPIRSMLFPTLAILIPPHAILSLHSTWIDVPTTATFRAAPAFGDACSSTHRCVEIHLQG